VLRRLSGGTGVVHAGDLAVSIALPATRPQARDIRGFYAWFLDVVLAALAQVGVAATRAPVPGHGGRGPGPSRSPVCFEDASWETLLVGGRKAVGCAQVRRARACLVHGALALDAHVALYAGAFRADPVRLAGRLGALPLDPGARTRLEGALEAGFRAALGG